MSDDNRTYEGLTFMDVVLDEATKLGQTIDKNLAEYILWEHTGFPSFWQIPEDGDTPEACLRTQVRGYFQGP